MSAEEKSTLEKLRLEKLSLEKLTPEELTLDDVRQRVWNDLRAGVANRRHGFHTPSVASIGGSVSGDTTTKMMATHARVVVLREADEEQHTLIFHTDIRSPKVEEIKAHAQVALVFYDAETRVQVLASGDAHIHFADDFARRRWNETNVWSRRAYLSQVAPGTKISTPSSCLPEEIQQRKPTLIESEQGWQNFAVVVVDVKRFEWLWLTSKGNLRAGFAWNGAGFEASWLAP